MDQTTQITEFIAQFKGSGTVTVHFTRSPRAITVTHRDFLGKLLSEEAIKVRDQSHWDTIYAAYDGHPSFAKHVS